MITGLQITVHGEELRRRIAERIKWHEAALGVLDARIEERAGDQPFDIRLEDGFKTLGELEVERQQCRSRLSELTLLRDSIVPGEVYALDRADLRLADLIAPDVSDRIEPSNDVPIQGTLGAAIDGLRVRMTGGELLTLLQERIRDHRRRADWWRREQARTPDDQTEDEPLLPDHMCENEAERHDWRAAVLGFIRDRIEPTAVYWLGEDDLGFGELLPEKPDWMEQQEYEERTSVGFHLERLTKRLSGLVRRDAAFAAPSAVDDE